MIKSAIKGTHSFSNLANLYLALHTTIWTFRNAVPALIFEELTTSTSSTITTTIIKMKLLWILAALYSIWLAFSTLCAFIRITAPMHIDLTCHIYDQLVAGCPYTNEMPGCWMLVEPYTELVGYTAAEFHAGCPAINKAGKAPASEQDAAASVDNLQRFHRATRAEDLHPAVPTKDDTLDMSDIEFLRRAIQQIGSSVGALHQSFADALGHGLRFVLPDRTIRKMWKVCSVMAAKSAIQVSGRSLNSGGDPHGCGIDA